MILLIDNYDSFVHNLARYLCRLGQTTRVVRNDTVDASQVRALAPQAIILSPGPCTPAEAGCCCEVVRELAGTIPMLGVCLGHQAIATAWGGSLIRAREPVHGRASEVFHDGRGIFGGLPSPLLVGRYHSLIVDPRGLPSCLQTTAHTSEGCVMALEHRQYPVVGLQFHPESILTRAGYALLAGFLRVAGLPVPVDLPEREHELLTPRRVERAVPKVPVTF